MHIRGAKYTISAPNRTWSFMYQFIREKSKMNANDTVKLPYFERKQNRFIFFLKIRTKKI